ncbi:MAG: GAF domain-containing protein [Steroidobacteraceae bacterium]
MGSVVPLHAHPARHEADRLASAAPPSAAFRIGALGAQARLLTLLGTDAPLPILLDALARYVETWAPSLLCSILLRDPRRNLLVRGAAPSLPREYVELIDDIPIGEDVGCCGTAAWRREPVTVYDIATSPLWDDHRHLALPHGLRACWSVPFLEDSGEVLGTLALYYQEPREPDAEERALITFAAALAKMVVLQHRRQAALWASNERVTLERSVIETAELEREQLAIDLHDGVSQQLVGIEWLLSTEAGRASGAQAEALRQIRDLVAGLQRDVRTLATWMLPLARRKGEFAPAIEDLVREAGAQHRLPCRAEIHVQSGMAPLDEALREGLLRVLQGALSHALTRPDCTGVEVRADIDDADVRLEVRAGGQALADGESPVLRAARYRALQVGASLSFAAGSGTPDHSSMRLRLPLKPTSPLD